MGATLETCSSVDSSMCTMTVGVNSKLARIATQHFSGRVASQSLEEEEENLKAPTHGIWGNAAKEFVAPLRDSVLENTSGDNNKSLWQEKLYSSAREGNYKKVVEALGKHADIHGRTSRGQTALMLASAAYGKSSLDAMRFLVDTKSEMEAKDNNGWTPLLYACRNSQLEAANLLIEGGASIKSRSNDGSTSVMLAARDGGEKLVMDLLAKQAPIDKKDDRGWTLLFVACEDGRLELVKWLLRKSANVKDKSKENQTVMMVAATSGNTKVAEKLLKKMANLNSQTNDGDTALLVAIKTQQEEFAKWLVENGTDVTVRNARGEDAICLAESWGMTMLRSMIEHRIRAVND